MTPATPLTPGDEVMHILLREVLVLGLSGAEQRGRFAVESSHIELSIPHGGGGI